MHKTSVDVTKFGNNPDGGGHRFVGRMEGSLSSAGWSDLLFQPPLPPTGTVYNLGDIDGTVAAARRAFAAVA